MLNSVASRVGLVCCLILAFAVSVPAGAQARKPLPDYAAWPHEGSDLKPDPRIRYGQLSNGMRYAIMRTTKPEGHGAIRLRFSAGSLNETDPEQGLAHFLEHMAFQGSKNLTRNEFVQKLQRLGLSFGADTNASTGFDQTLYMLNLPRTDATTFDESMGIIREVADRLTITKESVDSEKGVILSEERVRDTPGLRSIKRQFADLYAGMKLPSRFPIGTAETIKGATPALLRGFYERYYRPERAILIVTGEIDVDAVEGKIKALFSDWKQPGKMGPEPERGVAQMRPLRAINFVDPSFPGTVSVNWLAHEDWRPSNRADEIVDLRRGMAQAVVNARLSRLSEQPDPPFAGASVGCTTTEQGDGMFARRCILSVRASAKGLKTGLAAAEQVLRQSIQFAPDRGQMDRTIKTYRGFLQAAATGADTTATPDMANQIAGYFAARAVLIHPQDYLDLWEEVGPKFTPDELQAELKALYGGEPAQIFAQTATPYEGGEAALMAAYADSRAVPVAAATAYVQADFPYTNFGKPGAVKSRKDHADLGVTQVTFKNGVRLNIRPSQEEKGLVRIAMRLEGGVLSFPKDKPSFSSGIEWILFQGGLGKMTAEQLNGVLAGEWLDTNWTTANANYVYSATAKKDSVLKVLQSYGAYLTDPAFRPESLDQAKTNYARSYKGRSATAGSLLGWELGRILADDDPRFRFPAPEEANAATLAQVKALIAPVLAQSPIEIAIVGDIAVDDAIAHVGRTMGALKARRAMRMGLMPAGSRRYPSQAKTITLEHDGRADQAQIVMAWPGSDVIANPRKARAASLAEGVLSTALTLALRDKGLTYSAGGGYSPSDEVVGSGQLTVSVETKPENLDAVRALVLEQVKAVVEGNFSDDLLKRAREPEVSAREADLKSNSYWVDALADSQAIPSRLDFIRSRVEDFKTISRDEIVAAAREIFNDPRRLEIRVTAKAKP